MKKNLAFIFTSFVLVFFCTSCFFAQNNARTISVSGSGSVKIPADSARLTFSVQTKESTAIASVQTNAAKMNKVYEALKAMGISESDISTENYNLYQEVFYRDGKNEPGKYVTSNNITVILDDVNQSGKVIDTAISAGVNQMNGISFFVKNSKEALDQARVLAFQQAKEKAELYAKEAGCKVGKVISISENSPSYPAVRVYADNASMKSVANSTTISGGQDSITATISVVFELK